MGPGISNGADADLKGGAPTAEQALRFLRSCPDLLAISTLEGELLWVNTAWSQLLGVDAATLLGRGYFDLIHPDDLESTSAVAARTATLNSDTPRLENRMRRSDGSYRHLLWSATVDDEKQRIYAVATDITDLRRSEAELRRREAESNESAQELARSASLLQATLESTTDGILVVSREGKIVSYNRKFVDMWRLPPDLVAEGDDEQALRHVADDLVDPAGFRRRVEELYVDAVAEAIDVLEFADGRVFERFCMPQRLDGEVVGRVWSFRDITERMRTERARVSLEARLQQSQRLEGLGRLAGGIAHDFNNHLVAILNYAELASEAMPDGSPARVDLDEVVRAAERASALTRELVAFSRQEIVEPRALAINELVAGTARMLSSTIGEDIELDVALDPDEPAVEADPSQLERALMNLAVNARDAMPEGGSLVIATESVRRPPTDDWLGGSVVRVTVSDDGVGMSEEVAKRAVEPFFSTKPSGEGTGLGLATVYGIVNQSGGHLEIVSEPGKGTTVTIDLPAADAPAAVPSAELLEPEPVAASGTVLVVEDEAPVRRLTARLLRDAGYVALEASRGAEALDILRRNDLGDLRLMVTDIVMPAMSGRELAERAAAIRPGLPVLFMSGYTDDIVVRHGVASEDISFISKPFTKETLLDAVGAAIGGKAG